MTNKKKAKWEEHSRSHSLKYLGVSILSVHHYVGCGETWFLSAAYDFEREYLIDMGDSDG